MNICPSHPHWVLEHSRDQSSSKHDFTTGKKAFMIHIYQHCSLISEFNKAPLTGFVLWYWQARQRSLLLQCIYSSRFWGCVLVSAVTGRYTHIDTWLPGADLHVTLHVYSLCPMAFLISLQRMFIFPYPISSLFHLFPWSAQSRPCLRKLLAVSHWSIHSRRGKHRSRAALNGS